MVKSIRGRSSAKPQKADAKEKKKVAATKSKSAVPVDDTATSTPSTDTAATDAAPLPAAPASPKPSVNAERMLVAAGVTTDEDLPF